MTSKQIRRLTLIVACVATLGACSLFDRGRSARDAEAAADREGRIAMVLADEKLTPSPELATQSIELPPARTVADWAQAGAGPTKSIGHVIAAPDLEIAWRANAGRGSSRRSALVTPPVASDQAIFTIDASQTVRAFDLDTGARLWERDLLSVNPRDTTGIGSGIAYHDGKVIVASGFGFVTTLDAQTGARYWRTNMEAPMTGSPTISENRVFVSSNNNEVFALDFENGVVLWSDQAISESARVLGSPSVAAVEDIVVVPYSSGEVIAYLAANGRRLWSEALVSPGQFTPISAINDIGARPILGGGLVFAASQSGVLAAIDGRTGTRIWQQPLGAIQAPTLAGQYLFAVSVDAEMVCFDAASGQVVWVTQLEQYRNDEKKRGRITYSGPLVASDRVLTVSSEGQLIALDPQTGTELDRLRLGDNVYIEPIAVQGRVYVLTDDARLIAVR